MGDYLNRITGRHAPAEAKKKPESSAIVNAVKSFRDAVYAMLGRNISGRDADLWARASMVPWHFPDVPEFNGDKHIRLNAKHPVCDEQNRIARNTISI